MRRNLFRPIWESFPRWFRLLLVSTVGFSLILFGLVFLVLPGPGVAILIAAFLVLGLEFAWAERFLLRMRKRAQSVRNFTTRALPFEEESEYLPHNSDSKQIPHRANLGNNYFLKRFLFLICIYLGLLLLLYTVM